MSTSKTLSLAMTLGIKVHLESADDNALSARTYVVRRTTVADCKCSQNGMAHIVDELVVDLEIRSQEAYQVASIRIVQRERRALVPATRVCDSRHAESTSRQNCLIRDNDTMICEECRMNNSGVVDDVKDQISGFRSVRMTRLLPSRSRPA